MRRWMVWLLILALLCGTASAASVTDALGITGGEDASARGDGSARTTTDLFVVMNDGSDKALVRIPRAGGEAVKVESAASISDLVAIDALLYFLRVTDAGTSLMRRNIDGSRTEIYAFAKGAAVSVLSAFQNNLYTLIDNQIHMIYPSNGQCVKLVGTEMSDYVVVGDYLYYVSMSDMLSYETASLLDKGTITGSAGCLYRLNLQSGVSSLVLKSGVKDLRYHNGALYFHNLADNYVMGDEAREWIEGKLYRYDLSAERLERVVNGYDWGFYPVNGGVAVYTSASLDLYSDAGVSLRNLYAPEAYAVLSGGGDAIVVYEPIDTKVTYVLPDGATANASEGEPNYVMPVTTPAFDNTLDPLTDPAETADTGDASLSTADTGWFDAGATGSPSGSASGSSGGSSSGSSGSGGSPTVTDSWGGSGGGSGSYTEKDGG